MEYGCKKFILKVIKICLIIFAVPVLVLMLFLNAMYMDDVRFWKRNTVQFYDTFSLKLEGDATPYISVRLDRSYKETSALFQNVDKKPFIQLLKQAFEELDYELFSDSRDNEFVLQYKASDFYKLLESQPELSNELIQLLQQEFKQHSKEDTVRVGLDHDSIGLYGPNDTSVFISID
ncbi:MAG: hypothetical protein Q4B80_05455 [Aerococcaceae bacterium]|nr:hypothetical protein [Aerococcaceae bacterium]